MDIEKIIKALGEYDVAIMENGKANEAVIRVVQKTVNLGDIVCGETFFLGQFSDYQFLKLYGETEVNSCRGRASIVIANKPVTKCYFGKTNDYKESEVYKFLRDTFLPKIKAEIGFDKIFKMKSNIYSLDGLTEYGEIEDYVLLMSIDAYRNFRHVLPREYNNSWWLINPYSCSKNGYHHLVLTVTKDGTIDSVHSETDKIDVYPIMTLSNSTIVRRE